MKTEHNTPKPSLRQIYLDAKERRSPEARAAYLEKACGSDRTLRSKVEALLREAVGDSFLETPAAQLDETQVLPLAEGPGSVIGRYKLLQKIGEGGFGVVYMAEQQEPVVRRVALKIIKPGMDTRQVITRFEAERQALAMMDHPYVASVFDAGATESGRPFFVMELVRGIPITKYCDQNELTVQERLELFLGVCSAIQHAHQKGIIHRDIKPSNVMITLHDDKPVPKVIDFGIAKAIEQRLTDKTLFTNYAQFVGTPAYVSPEQAQMSGLDIDTRSDIYSLGVLLYELLTGRTPLDSRELIESGIDEIRRRIREEEPVKPSTRLSTLGGAEQTSVARHRRTDPARLRGSCRGELDWIVMKALERDRSRRYDTAKGLANDVRRHLNHEPVEAAAPSLGYRSRKFIARHRTAVATVSLVTAALVAGTVVSVWQAIRATRASQRASQAHQETVAALDTARQSEQRAKDRTLAARRNLYASDIYLAQQALQASDTGRARSLLEGHIPSRNRAEFNAAGDVTNDLRGWEWRYLWGQLQSGKPKVFATLPGAVFGLDVSPDGRHLAASTTSGLLKLWELPSGQEVATIEPGVGLPTKPVFFSDSSRLVYHYWTEQSTNGLLKIWDLRTQRVSREIHYPSAIGPKAVGPDGQRILFGAWPGNVRLYDLRTGLAPWENPVLVGTAMHNSDSFLFAEPDGREWVMGDVNGNIRVFDVETGRPSTQWKAHPGAIFALNMSHDGGLLASACVSIKVWNYQTRELLGELKGHQNWVGDVEFTSDGSRLVSSSADQTVRLWDLKTFTELYTFRGADQEVWEVELSPDDRTIYAGAKNGKICVWDAMAQPRKDSAAVADAVECFALSRSGHHLAILSTNHSVKTGEIGDDIALAGADYAGTDNSCISLSPDGNQLIAGKTNGGIAVYSVATGELLHSNHVHSAGITHVRTLASGNQVLSSDLERNLLLQKIDGGNPEVLWEVTMEDWEHFGVQTLTVSSDERTLAAGSFIGRVTLWDLPTGRKRSFQNPSLQPIIYGLAFSPDGHTLATADVSGTVRLWDTATLRRVADWQAHRNDAGSVTFSPDGQRLVSGGGGEDTLIIWDLATDRALLRFQLKGGVRQLAFSPDGNRLFVLSGRTLYAWYAPP